ncbi:MAG: sulfite exporter TauE/SafE family protein [Promethearchaeota archaeon]
MAWNLTLIVILGILFGFLIGFFAALSGTGGGSLNVPIFDIVLLMPMPVAIGTSSFTIFLSSLSTNLAYAKQKRIDYRTGLISIISIAPMSILGTLAKGYLGAHVGVTGKTLLGIIFYCFILFVGFYMLRRKKDLVDHPSSTSGSASCQKKRNVLDVVIEDVDGTRFEYKVDLFKIIPLSLLSGFSSGFLGIGGGLVNVPMLHFVCDMPIHVVLATSAFMIMISSFFSTATNLFIGQVDIFVGLMFAAGGLIGVQLGARFAKKQKSRKLKFIIAGILIIVSIVKLILMICDLHPIISGLKSALVIKDSRKLFAKHFYKF